VPDLNEHTHNRCLPLSLRMAISLASQGQRDRNVPRIGSVKYRERRPAPGKTASMHNAGNVSSS